MGRHSPSLVIIHFVWATFARRRLLSALLDESLQTIIASHADRAGCRVLAIGCAADHVHVLLRFAADARIKEVVQRMKGGTAHEVNRRGLVEGSRLRWQAGYWAESVSPCDTDRLAHYVCSQRAHHDDSHPAEEWQRFVSPEPADRGGL